MNHSCFGIDSYRAILESDPALEPPLMLDLHYLAIYLPVAKREEGSTLRAMIGITHCPFCGQKLDESEPVVIG